MGWWSAYFLAKLALHAGGHLEFFVPYNLALALLTALRPRNDRQRLARNVVAVPAAIVLAYAESWLPGPARLLSGAAAVGDFSPAYLAELAGRLFDWHVLLWLLPAFGAWLALRRRLRMEALVFLGIAIVALAPLWHAGGGAGAAAAATQAAAGADPRLLESAALDGRLRDFAQSEALRGVRFAPPPAAARPFDIIILHVCSLSWDDLRATGDAEDPLLARFDLLFTGFNSAASYSGPAAIRLLRGACGQPRHRDLYQGAQPQCLLVAGLQSLGFEPHWLMNHDGHFGNFFGEVRDNGGMPVAPDANAGAAVAMHAFDGTPVYDDYSVLSRWWQARLQRGTAREVLYYNTISLHDGNRVAGSEGLRGAAAWSARMRVVSAGVGRFLDDIRRSGRRAVVVFVPEHGGAVAGDRHQIAGLRDIPTPAITGVPVGVALVGAPAAAQARDAGPASYLALAELLSRLVAGDPFGQPGALAAAARSLPQTDWVAENADSIVMRVEGHTMVRRTSGSWYDWDQ